MISQQIDDRRLIARLQGYEHEAPRSIVIALNDAAFAVRTGWMSEISKVFDRPTPITQRAPLVKKATQQNPQAEIYIRNEATKGTPPAEYLIAQAEGGQRSQKPFERRLARVALGRQFYVPGKGAADLLNAYGNMPARVISKILSQLQARFDPSQNETEKSRARRLRKQRKKGGGGSFFVLANNRGKLKAGVVYERINEGNGESRVRSVLFPVDAAPSYRQRFKPVEITTRIFNREFERRLTRLLIGRGRG